MTTPSIQEPGDWIEWPGGECPVADDVLVDVRWPGGSVTKCMPAQAWLWRWRKAKPGVGDIIAYRVVSK